MREFFARLDEKHKLLGNFGKILKFFDENSIEKSNFFIFIFRKCISKNSAFGNTTIFLLHFFRFRGGVGISPFPPGYALAFYWSFIEKFKTFPKYLYSSSQPMKFDGSLKFCKNKRNNAFLQFSSKTFVNFRSFAGVRGVSSPDRQESYNRLHPRTKILQAHLDTQTWQKHVYVFALWN